MSPVALVTGAGRGLGRACAVRLARGGFNVAINCHSSVSNATELSSNLEEEFGIRCRYYAADVANSDEVSNMVKLVLDEFGSIDVLVNNAGIRKDGAFLFQKASVLWDVMKTNYGGTINCSKSVLPSMLTQRSGVIINVTSISGSRGVAGQTAYSSSKAAIEGFSRSLSKEVGPRGIAVACVAPGLLGTDMTEDLPADVVERFVGSTAIRRLGTTEEIAEMVFALSNGLAAMCQGQVIVMDGGASR